MRDAYTNYPRSILWLVPGGSVMIGGDEEHAQPRFQADVAPFYIGKIPITNMQFEAFDPAFQRSGLAPRDRDAATGISYHDALAYCRWYSEIARKPFRLASEIEWEYACRAGTSGPRFFDDRENAGDFLWGLEADGEHLADPESIRPNAFGLFGMLGGIWEWTGSPYRPYPLDGIETQTQDHSGPQRVLRGGSVREKGAHLTCSLRRGGDPALRSEDIGFRIVRSFR